MATYYALKNLRGGKQELGFRADSEDEITLNLSKAFLAGSTMQLYKVVTHSSDCEGGFRSGNPVTEQVFVRLVTV